MAEAKKKTVKKSTPAKKTVKKTVTKKPVVKEVKEVSTKNVSVLQSNNSVPYILGIVVVALLVLFGAFLINEQRSKKDAKVAAEKAAAFKEDYESLNGQKIQNSSQEYRTVSIPEDNPFYEVKDSDIVDMINKKETFYVYFGDEKCPWCRSTIEKAVEVAKKYKVDKIYYVAIWDDNYNEIVRDKYRLNGTKLEVVSEGSEAYKELLKAFDSKLSDYKLKSDAGVEIEVGEKRIYAPNYFYVKDGKLEKFVAGKSELQKGALDELTEEILADEEKQFTEFFKE